MRAETTYNAMAFLKADELAVGLDPPLDAVCAYMLNKSGSDRDAPDTQWYHQAVLKATSGWSSWSGLMADAPGDSSRLLAMDMACNVRVGTLQLLDDNKIKTSSYGTLALRMEGMERAAASIKAELRYGPGKSEFSVHGGHEQRAIGQMRCVDPHLSRHPARRRP